MDITVYLPDELGERAKKENVVLSRMLRDALTALFAEEDGMSETLTSAGDEILWSTAPQVIADRFGSPVRFDPAAATLLCNDQRGASRRFLFRTKGGRYIRQTIEGAVIWGNIANVDVAELEARKYYLSTAEGERHVSFEEAFPGVAVDEA